MLRLTKKDLHRAEIDKKINQYANASDMAGVFLLNMKNGANPEHEMRYLRLAMQKIMDDTESCIQILINICKAYSPASLPIISLYCGYTNLISVNTLCSLMACFNISHQQEIHSLQLETKALNETIKKMTEIISRLQNEQNISSNNTNLDQMNNHQMINKNQVNGDLWGEVVGSRRNKSDNNISF